MICEIALVELKEGAAAEYEASVRKGVSLLQKAKGFVSLRWVRSLSQPGRYRLILEWETVDNHKVDFMQSPAFEEWRALVGPFFKAIPDVEYFEDLGYWTASR